MRKALVTWTALIVNGAAVLAQPATTPFDPPMPMQLSGKPVVNSDADTHYRLTEFSTEIPTAELSALAEKTISEVAGAVRSAKDAQIYRAIAPAVVLIATKEGFGRARCLILLGTSQQTGML